ncbi:MAG: hypothetical protein DCC57_15335 [Chloroflexi bacterium]|nr:MAG: hypothetical protein DCC57_15335 [Chloroflexota bacterium]
MARLMLYLLGQFHATLDGQPLTAFKTDKVRALLAYLAVERGRAHRREPLSSLFWPEAPADAVRANLRQSLCRLRDALHDQGQVRPWLLVTPEAVQLDPAGDYWVDALEFDHLLAQCSGHRHRSLAGCRACAERLAQAVALYRGEFLAGLCVRDSPEFAQWSLVHQQTLHRKVMDALQHLALQQVQRGEAAAAEAYLRRQIALEPWCEPAHRQLMRLYAASGQRGEAVAQYRCCRRALGEQLGLAPDSETTALYDSIRAGQPFTLSAWRIENAPTPSAPLVGRTDELARIGETLQNPDCRLLTLVGLGGCGKTSLARAAAAQEIGAFRDGVCFCSPASASAGAPSVSVLAQAFGLPAAHDAQAQVVQFLRHKEMLLVLDDLEDQRAADWIAHLLHAAPGVVILATSRRTLGIRAEWRFEVRGLAYPEPDCCAAWPDLLRFPAVQLFVQCAGRARAGFTLTEHNAPHITRICRQVEGLPLALELAASWAGMMACAEIADAIDAGLDFLETTWRDLPARQRSLRASFDDSWGRLRQEEQEALACLSVFGGEFGHAAARAVVGALCAHRCRQDAAGERPRPSAGCLFRAFVEQAWLYEVAPGRYRLHGLLRRYAEEKLSQHAAEHAATRLRFCAYFAGLVERVEAARGGPQAEEWRERLHRERHNLETAHTWALSLADAAPEVAACLARALTLCGGARGSRLGAAWIAAQQPWQEDEQLPEMEPRDPPGFADRLQVDWNLPDHAAV